MRGINIVHASLTTHSKRTFKFSKSIKPEMHVCHTCSSISANIKSAIKKSHIKNSSILSKTVIKRNKYEENQTN